MAKNFSKKEYLYYYMKCSKVCHELSKWLNQGAVPYPISNIWGSRQEKYYVLNQKTKKPEFTHFISLFAVSLGVYSSEEMVNEVQYGSVIMLPPLFGSSNWNNIGVSVPAQLRPRISDHAYLLNLGIRNVTENISKRYLTDTSNGLAQISKATKAIGVILKNSGFYV